jgi:hypothetical protein
MSVDELPARNPGATALPELLAELGVCKDSLIQITGPDGLGMLLWFCRHGYEHAAYVKCGAPCPSEPADALVAPHAMTREAVLQLLDGRARVRPGGALVLQVLNEPANAPGASETDPGELLERFGYRIMARIGRGDRELIAARRRATVYAEAA